MNYKKDSSAKVNNNEHIVNSNASEVDGTQFNWLLSFALKIVAEYLDDVPATFYLANDLPLNLPNILRLKAREFAAKQ